MAIPADVLLAKQALSTRLLRAGLQGNVIASSFNFRVSDAVSNAGRNVHAVGVGRKIVEGQPTEITAVRVYVTQKIAVSLLPSRDRLPETIDGIPVDVIESPPAFILTKKRSQPRAKVSANALACTDNRKNRQRPVIAGISTALYTVTAGTISCFCRSNREGDNPAEVFVLSNNHVFANVNQAGIGDDLYQPGPADGGTQSDHFAELHRFAQIILGGQVPNRVDAAIGKLLPGIEYQPEICQIGKLRGVGQATEGMTVCKHGRTTGYTEGIVTDESVNALVGMNHSNSSVVALFENQIRIERTPSYPAIGLGGDSGSLVVSKNGTKAVGLYFAGPQGGEYGLANHIAEVIDKLQIVLL